MATLLRYFSKRKSPERTPGPSDDQDAPEQGTSSDSADRPTSNNELNSNSEEPPPAKKRKHVFMESWRSTRPWLYVDAKNIMYCSWCVTSKKSNAFTDGCTNFRTSTLDRHVALPSHKEAMHDITLRANMESASKTVFNKKTDSLIRALQTTYWLAKENVASSKYGSLLDFLDFQGVDVSSMAVGGNASYQSRATIEEFQGSICEVIEEELLKKVHKSPYISVMCDESTDVSNSKKLIVYTRIIDPDSFKASTHFLGNVTIQGSSCTAEVLFNKMSEFLEDKQINLNKVLGFGSDGASVMTGKKSGVATRFREKSPHLIGIHCMAHRLNLCTSQASKYIPYMKDFEEIFVQLYRYFEKSANREAELKEIQKIVDSPELKIREVHEIRWLAFYDALIAVFHSYKAIVTYFKRNQKAKGAQEILGKMTDYRFVSIMYLMMDIIPYLSQLCLVLQKSDVDIAAVKPAIDNTLDCIKRAQQGKTHYQSVLKENLKEVNVDDKIKVSFKDIELSVHRSTIKKASDDIDKIRKEFAAELIAQLTARFPSQSRGVAEAFDVLGLRNLTFLTSTEIESHGIDKIQTLCTHFGEEKSVKDVKSAPIIDINKTLAEWSLAKTVIKQELYPRDRMHELWKSVHTHHKETFPNLLKLASIAAIMPYQTADCERGFSQQNITKSKLRNRLEQTSLQRLMMIKLEGPSIRDFDYQQALKKWQEKKDRRVFKNK